MKILLYTFYKRWGLCSRVVWEMPETIGSDDASIRSPLGDHSASVGFPLQLGRYYINGLRGVSGLLKKIEEENFDYIIGLGDYRKDAKKIKIETKFVNKYGKNKILEEGGDCYCADEKLMGYCREQIYLFPTEMQISDTATNGPCNRSAYLVSGLIARKGLKTAFLFLHVPRSMKIDGVKSFLFVLLRILRQAQYMWRI